MPTRLLSMWNVWWGRVYAPAATGHEQVRLRAVRNVGHPFVARFWSRLQTSV